MTLTNREVAKRFADGKTTGNSTNMCIKGDTIYSYGPHFPIAVRISGGYIFNSDYFSSSTGKHKAHVAREIYNDILWELPDCELNSAVEAYTNQAHEAMKKIPGSRTKFHQYFKTLKFNFRKIVEASETLNQSIQPLYNVLNKEIAATAMSRIQKEMKIPEDMLTVFGKAQFLGQSANQN